MNIRIRLKLKELLESSVYFLTLDTMLKPFYISENEVLNVFFDEYSLKYFKAVRELIFINSMRADDMVGSLDFLSPKEIMVLKKKITTCLTIRDFGNKFNKDFIAGLTRSKTFADFSVSTTHRNDPRFVHNIIKDAEDCIDHISKLIDVEDILTPALGYTFVKGANNPLNNDRPARLWHHGNLSVLSKEIIAFDKKWFDGKKYKNGYREDLRVPVTRIKD